MIVENQTLFIVERSTHLFRVETDQHAPLAQRVDMEQRRQFNFARIQSGEAHRFEHWDYGWRRCQGRESHVLLADRGIEKLDPPSPILGAHIPGCKIAYNASLSPYLSGCIYRTQEADNLISDREQVSKIRLVIELRVVKQAPPSGKRHAGERLMEESAKRFDVGGRRRTDIRVRSATRCLRFSVAASSAYEGGNTRNSRGLNQGAERQIAFCTLHELNKEVQHCQ